MSEHDTRNKKIEQRLNSLAEETRKHTALLKNITENGKTKDGWDKAAILTSILSSVVLTLFGMYLTDFYKTRDDESEKERADEIKRRDERDHRLHEIQLIASLMPSLTNESQIQKKSALLLVYQTGRSELMTQLAQLDDTSGSREALGQAYIMARKNPDEQKRIKTVLENMEERQKAFALGWFLSSFDSELEDVFGKTIFPKELVAAIAYEETGQEIWARLAKKGVDKDAIMSVCATNPSSKAKRYSWPKDHADFMSIHERGTLLYNIASQAVHDSANLKVPVGIEAAKTPGNFFCSFGPFSFDINQYKDDVDFFDRGQWKNFSGCATRLLTELNQAIGRQQWINKKSLTDDELAHLAIAYTYGTSETSIGLKQPAKSKDTDGKYFGERIYDLIQMARSVAP